MADNENATAINPQDTATNAPEAEAQGTVTPDTGTQETEAKAETDAQSQANEPENTAASNKQSAEEMLAEQQRELERIRGGRHHKGMSISTKNTIRKVLNWIFMLLALVGVVIYFAMPERQQLGMGILSVGMIFKIVEFLIRFLL